jgi:hypothetical protein
MKIPYVSFKVFTVVLHQLLALFWVSAFCSGWRFRYFGRTPFIFRVIEFDSDWFIYHEDGGSTFIRNIGTFKHYAIEKPLRKVAVKQRNSWSAGLNLLVTVHEPVVGSWAQRFETSISIKSGEISWPAWRTTLHHVHRWKYYINGMNKHRHCSVIIKLKIEENMKEQVA